jgi:hypothetical protein
MTFKSSLYAKTSLRPVVVGALLAVAGAVAAALIRPAFARRPRRRLARFWW